MSTSMKRPDNRRRASSISQALNAIPLNEPALAGVTEDPSTPTTPTSPFNPLNELTSTTPGTPPVQIQLNGSETSFKEQEAVLRERRATKAAKSGKVAKGKKQSAQGRFAKDEEDMYLSEGFWKDLKTGRWMVVPSSSFILLAIPIVLHILQTNFAPSTWINPWEAMIFPSHKIYKSAGDAGAEVGAMKGEQMFARGWLDFVFLSYYVIVFSFVRQAITLHVLRPYGKWLGIPRGKMERFTEQGYAIVYFGFFGSLGIYVMSGLPIWWYQTSMMWTTFPVLEMPRLLKCYYLWQLSYWIQQTVILAARVEKPRKDFKELVAHHLVTLYLVGWSYCLTYTYIGVAIFVTMDVSDTFLAFAKCVNYWREEYSTVPFAVFVVVWTYFRHYLNIWILWSVWFETRLIPEECTGPLDFSKNQLAPKWLKLQMFLPILMLQGINLFWYFLILRILYRAVFGQNLADDRSDDEDEGETDKPVLEDVGDQKPVVENKKVQ